MTHTSLVFCFFCFFQAVTLMGQPVFLDVDSAKKLYPNEAFVILSKSDKYTICIDHDSLIVTRKRQDQFLYLKNMAAFNTERSLQSSSFVHLTKYSGYTYLPNGKKFQRIAVKDVAIKNSADGNIFFDDQKEYLFKFPGIEAGAVLELNSEHTIKEPRFIPSLIFQSTVPIYRYSCTIECDANIDIDITDFNMASVPVRFSKTEGKGKTIYSWTGENIPAIKDEKYQAGLRYYIAHTVPVVSSYTLKNGDVKRVLSSTQDLYTWYSSFLDSVNNQSALDYLQPVTDSIVSGLTSDYEKAEAIFYWVQSNIKYIAFEAGMGGLIPRNANDIYDKRYGDCKDKTSIMQVMMSGAGLKAHFCWIGSDDLPYKYSDVHAPLVDNHMILGLELDGKFHFLDGTGVYNNFHLPTSFIQGKEVLVAISKDSFLIKQVPIIPATENQINDSVYFTIDSTGVLHGTGKLKLTGYAKLYFQHSLLGEDEKEQRAIIDEYAEVGSNKCVLNTYTLPAIDNFDTEIVIPHSVTLADYTKKLGDEMYINMNMYQSWTKYDLEKDRETPMHFRFCSSYLNSFYFEIPEDYELEFLPKDVSFEHPIFNFTTSYEQVGNTIAYRHFIIVDTRYVTKDMFDDWQAFILELKKSYRQSVALKIVPPKRN